MGDVSIISRRLADGKKVQYGWSGNGGYYKMVGNRLLCWYDDPEKVEYLFGLGQMRLIGKPNSERGGEGLFFTNTPDNMPHWVGNSEREIFSKIAFIDYGYFYDLDNTWYYIILGCFRIKIPLEYIHYHLDDRDFEFDELRGVERRLAEYILGDYYENDNDFKNIVTVEYAQGIADIREDVLSNGEDDNPCYYLWKKYKKLFDYFDDWVVAKTNDDMSDISRFLIRKKQSKNRVETIDWN